ncbi:hypothetical protein ACRYCC_27980 [Actinomadura scrupuli]|uniref:hypothetical protein n=1 Tax=Actinomadura scrupuli TaxID=559629 RepID=UPI003D9930AC
MPYVPPVVHAEHIDGLAYLLGWERMPVADGGGWAARLGWVEIDDAGAWKLRGGSVPAGAVRQVPGQDYSRVPRDPRPRDPSDTRSQNRKDRPADRAYFDEMLRRSPGPDHGRQTRDQDGDF